MTRFLIIGFLLTACSSEQATRSSTQGKADQVCLAFEGLDKAQTEGRNPDEVFNLVADKVQPQLEPGSDMWEVLEVLRNVVTEQRYEIYVFTGDELGEDWRCEAMETRLTP